MQFFMVLDCSGIAHELPLRRQVWICDDLSWWLIQKNLPGIAPTPQPFTPKGLRVLKAAVLQKSSLVPFLTSVSTYM